MTSCWCLSQLIPSRIPSTLDQSTDDDEHSWVIEPMKQQLVVLAVHLGQNLFHFLLGLPWEAIESISHPLFGLEPLFVTELVAPRIGDLVPDPFPERLIEQGASISRGDHEAPLFKTYQRWVGACR